MRETWYSKVVNSIKGSATEFRARTLASDLDVILLLSDKKIAILGDSISALAEPNQWIDYALDKVVFANVDRLAIGGAKWTHTASTVYNADPSGGANDDNVIWNQFNKLKVGVDATTYEQPDVIFILAGTNDTSMTIGTPATEFASGTTILDKAPGTITNICKAVRLVVESILQEWPYCQVIISTPFQRGIADNSTIFAIGDAIEGCGKYLSCPIIRADKEVGIYGFNDISNHIFLSDNLHPNEYGAQKIAKLFVNKLRTNIQI